MTRTRTFLLPSQWAEQFRFLPMQLSSRPGFYRFAWAPYMKEPLDCLAEHSPVREMAMMKGGQIGATVSILENYLGYLMAHVRTAPAMLVTADDDVAKKRLELCIVPMLIHSGLQGLVRSSDETSRKKTGRTATKIEWRGGGFLILSGAKSPNNMISFSAKAMLRDEIDTWPQNVGKSGDPIVLTGRRTAAYESQRKVVDLSTPLLEDQSHIQRRFRRGDQRYYFVKCLKCEHEQRLRWRRVNEETGEVTGIVWQGEATLVPGSVRYLCEKCAHPHREEDKERLLCEQNARWVPTSEPISPQVRSYHLSSLYSRFQTWEALVLLWLEAWDVTNNRPRDVDALQAFYNTVLGVPFELRGEKVRFSAVSSHRRSAYHYGQVPNKWATQYCGGPVLLLTCTVDVHAADLAVAVFGWCRDRRALLVDYWRFEGDTEQLDDPGTWKRLEKLIEQQEYTADDGKRYNIALTLIDSGYRPDHVYRFAEQYEAGVFPVKGRGTPPQNANAREFSEFTTPSGLRAYGVTVDFYKDRWSAALRRHWDGMGLQPQGHFNAPLNATDKQLRELTVEVKRERIEKTTGKRIGWEWHRPSGAANELWDLLVYGNAALDLIAWNYSLGLKLETTNWAAFWDDCLGQKLFFNE